MRLFLVSNYLVSVLNFILIARLFLELFLWQFKGMCLRRAALRRDISEDFSLCFINVIWIISLITE